MYTLYASTIRTFSKVVLNGITTIEIIKINVIETRPSTVMYALYFSLSICFLVLPNANNKRATPMLESWLRVIIEKTIIRTMRIIDANIPNIVTPSNNSDEKKFNSLSVTLKLK
jgi:hypothetical protein